MSGKPWKTTELAELKRWYSTLGIGGCASRLGRSYASVRQQARKHKLDSGIGRFKPGEKNIKAKLSDAYCADLRINRHRLYPGLTIGQIAKIHGVSERTMGGILTGERRSDSIWNEEGRIRIPCKPMAIGK